MCTRHRVSALLTIALAIVMTSLDCAQLLATERTVAVKVLGDSQHPQSGQETTVPSILKVSQSNIGNIFLDNEPISFRIATDCKEIAWSVTDFWGHDVAHGKEAVKSDPLILEIPMKIVGYFLLRVSATNGSFSEASTSTAFAILPKSDAPDVPNSPFGVMEHYSWGNRSFESMKLIKYAWIQSIREDQEWRYIENAPGQYVFPAQYEATMTELKKNGIQPLLHISYSNRLYDSGMAPYTPSGIDAYSRYAQELGRHYSDQVRWLEVYNEWNYSRFCPGPAASKPESYLPLLKSTYKSIKSVRSDVKVVGCSTSLLPWQWLDRLFELGGLNYMDVVSVHPYQFKAPPDNLEYDMRRLKDEIAYYDKNKKCPIWVTEISWSTYGGDSGVTEAQQADYLVQAYVRLLAAGVEKIFWYNLIDREINSRDMECNQGLLHNWNYANGGYTPKPSYVAYAVMTRQLLGSKFESKDFGWEGISCYTFRKGQKSIQVFWSRTPGVISIKSSTPVRITDMMGQQRIANPEDGRLAIRVSADPVYVSTAD